MKKRKRKMATEKLVSIIIPAYNHQDYVQDTIRSLISQTYNNLELIIINDGSQDKTHEKIMDLERDCRKKFRDFIYINKQNEGLTKTLNQGTRLAKGDYIFFSASDDVTYPEAIARLMREVKDGAPDIVLFCGNAEFIDERGNMVYLDRRRRISYKHIPKRTFTSTMDYCRTMIKEFDPLEEFGTYKSFLVTCYIPADPLIKKDALFEVGLFDESSCVEDYDMFFKIAKKYKMRFVDKVLMQYRVHPENTTRMIPDKLRQSLFNLFLREKDYCFTHGYIKLWKERMLAFLISFLKKGDIGMAVISLRNIGGLSFFYIFINKLIKKIRYSL